MDYVLHATPCLARAANALQLELLKILTRAHFCFRSVAGLGLILLLILGSGSVAQAQAAPPDFKVWGAEVLNQIETDFGINKSGLYADQWKRGQAELGHPAFMWGCGVQLSALAAGARLEPEHYSSRLKRFFTALDVYWTHGDNLGSGVGGYDVLPGPKGADRYYDDNIWMALALTEAYEATHERVYRDRAKATFDFVLSGEDAKLGGGIYWREKQKSSKNTCSNGPAVAAALRLYQVTRGPRYLEKARTLYAWTNAHLQDRDGLYWDNIRLDGTVEKTKFSYNTGLMLRSNCLFYAVTHERRYLDEAERVARAAEAYWVKADTGAFADGGTFAHLLSEAFLALYEQDRDTHWRDIVQRALKFVHDKVRDTEGRYGGRWDQPVLYRLTRVGLLSQASVARAFLAAAHTYTTILKPEPP